MNKYTQILNWLTTNYTPLNSYLSFNVIKSEDGENSLTTEGGSTTLNSFIDGTAEKELNFAIVLVRKYDSETALTNVNSITETQDFIDWLRDTETLPDFGEDVTLNELKILDDVPDVGIDFDNNVAQYIFKFSINFMEKEN